MSGAILPLYVIMAFIGRTAPFIIKPNYSSILYIIIRGSLRKETRGTIRKQLRLLES